MDHLFGMPDNFAKNIRYIAQFHSEHKQPETTDTNNPILPDIDEFTPDEDDIAEAERQTRINNIIAEFD
jgi:hypothetical protein